MDFFDSHSKKVKSNGDQSETKNPSMAPSTVFDENGIMIPWWSKVASISNADKSNPSSDVQPILFGYDGGVLLKDSWFWMYPSENLDTEDYYDQECSWWHTDERGRGI